MPIQILIADEDLEGFSGPAIDQATLSIRKLGNDLLSEANRMGSTQRGRGNPIDVSADMVRTSEVLLRRGMVQKKARLRTRFFRVGPILLMFLGQFFWDKTSLGSTTYILTFGLLVALTIVWATAVAILD